MSQENLFSYEEDLTKYGFYKNPIIEGLCPIEDIPFIKSYIKEIHPETPFFTPKMKNGTNFNVQITSLGLVGWNADLNGYHYDKKHPNGKSWKGIPLRYYDLIGYWFDKFNLIYDPCEFDTCLINLYRGNGSLGMHQDKDEKDLTFPIMSFSIGSSAEFDIELGGKIRNISLTNGDVIVMDKQARNAKHGIKKINGNWRLNLTFRKAL